VRVVSLGSGSSGNALLIQSSRTAVLVDAGFGPRTLASRLRLAGVAPQTLGAILLTHEHSDHAVGAAAFAARHGVPLVSDPRTLAAVLAQPSAQAAGVGRIERVELPVGRGTRLSDFGVRSFAISHDAVAPCGFVLSTGAWSVCVVTDTGECTPAVVEALRGAHLIVLEANHDRERLLAGPYPWHLKRRILGSTGHLSNAQSSEALAQALDDGPRWVWLAHLSKTNNTPDLARAHVRRHLGERGLGHVRVEVAPPAMGPAWDSADLLGGPRQAPLFGAADAAPTRPSATITADVAAIRD
jgi:phosphoribosyl 1,2-cyclic phosphodiesterase